MNLELIHRLEVLGYSSIVDRLELIGDKLILMPITALEETPVCDLSTVSTEELYEAVVGEKW